MKIRCNCEVSFPVDIAETFPTTNNETGGVTRRQCPNCKRAYEITVRLVTEKAEWWNF